MGMRDAANEDSADFMRCLSIAHEVVIMGVAFEGG
jgi:hypothetical protein